MDRESVWICSKIVFVFFKQKTADEMLRRLVGSEMCIRDRCKDELRRRSRRPSESLASHGIDDDHPFDAPDPSEGAPEYLERIAVGEGIQSALMSLQFEQRQAIVLSDVHGYHYEEIARITGTNVGTVKSRIHRGRERLRGILLERPELFGRRGRSDD